MISAIFPSRGRPESLIAAANSLKWNATAPSQVEVIIAADPDDPDTITAAKTAGVWHWTAPERWGYDRLHLYYNHLAGLAHGDWLLLWNDDATMQTQGWDRVIEEQDPAVLWLGANHHHGASMFPAWPKAWAEALGHVSPVAHCDTYLQYLGEGLGGLERVPVEVMHDRADVTGGHDDQTFAEGRGRIGPYGMVPGFDGAAVREQVVQDVLTIEKLRAVGT